MNAWRLAVQWEAWSWIHGNCTSIEYWSTFDSKIMNMIRMFDFYCQTINNLQLWMRLLLQGCTEVLVFGSSLLFFRWDLWCHVFVRHDVWHEIFMHSWVIPSSAQTLGVRECGSYILKSNRFDTVSLEIRYWIVLVTCNILLQVWVAQWHEDRKANWHMLTGSTLIACPECSHLTRKRPCCGAQSTSLDDNDLELVSTPFAGMLLDLKLNSDNMGHGD